MALQLSFTHEETTYPEGYLKIDKVGIVKRPNGLVTMDLVCELYATKADRDDEKPYIKREERTGQYNLEGENAMIQGYAFLKNEFTQAVDV